MLTINFEKLRTKNHHNQPVRVLDLGCGEGRHAIGAYWLLDNCDIFGVDLAATDLAKAKQKFNEFRQQLPKSNNVFFIEADGLALPFTDQFFDIIICSEVLEHIEDYQAMVAEIKRLIKPQGQIAISVPRYWPEKICWWLSDDYHGNEGGHIRIFRRQELQTLMTDCGFALQGHHYAHSLHSFYWWLRCLFWQSGENQWLCKTYHKFLVWDLMQNPLLTRWLDKILNPIIGKSLVMYCQATPSYSEKTL